MKILDYIRQIDWTDEADRAVAEQLIADAEEYLRRVEAHIFQGNEIRADSFMDISEKQDEIRSLDRKRTAAHDRMLVSFAPFLDLLRDRTGFDEREYRIGNRTQIADFIASIAFELMESEPVSRIEGNVRDELAEKFHKGEFTFEQLETLLRENIGTFTDK